MIRMTTKLIKDLKDFKFSSFKLLHLPIDNVKDNFVRRNIPGVVFSHVKPTPLTNPKLISFSDDALVSILDMDPTIAETQEFVDFITGNSVHTPYAPLAHRYGGHQFGYWAMQLGDGRALLLGEYVNSQGERWELQLKGTGLTPYSRDGDGRAVLRSSIREYLCSEAMHYLGIPTSRAGAIIVSEDRVVRDLLYDGHPQLEPTSVVLRIAPSWFRIGSLEILAKNGEIELLTNLLNFIIKEHFPDVHDDEEKIINFLRQVMRSNINLAIHWQSVGFTHGVLNTDNISLLGITIDYGPFGFMEDYNFLFVPNHSDHAARYCYGRQIQIMLFNLMMLVKAVSPLLNKMQLSAAAKMLQDEAKYADNKLETIFSSKLGLERSPDIVSLLIKILEETKADFVMTFRDLSETRVEELLDPPSRRWALNKLSKHPEYSRFVQMYQNKLKETVRSDGERMEEMQKLNPCYTLRNWMAQEAIKTADNGDYTEVNRLLKILKNPFTRQPEGEEKGYSSKPPPWSKTLCLSCSS